MRDRNAAVKRAHRERTIQALRAGLAGLPDVGERPRDWHVFGTVDCANQNASHKCLNVRCLWEAGTAYGEAGIRTRDTGLTPYNGLANRRLQPLGHLSGSGDRSAHAIGVRAGRQIQS